MKKFERGVLLFLVLMLTLVSGSSYLALNEASTSKANKDDQKMTVALVNEDQGAQFNDENYEFGAEFIKNIEKDEKHDWYVVSRGVAESGLERNVYNMMIVIPNDFSQKALSLDSQSPEKVVLNYKINASENSNMKAKAERTASNILGDFNRRIIDVYFASIIGNLHDAQDNIGTLVKKEQVYTNVYNNAVHRPLAGFTSQFGAVVNNTEVSRESFKGLQDILNVFETNLGDGVKTGQNYQMSFMDFTNLQSANGLMAKSFSEKLRMLDSEMNHDDVIKQLDYLMTANKVINDEFHQKEYQSANILSESVALQTYLKNTKEKMNKVDTELADKLASDMQHLIGDKLKQEIRNASGQEQSVYMNHLFAKPDENARKTIQKHIDQLPTMNANDLDELGLNNKTVTQLKNVIAVTDKYNHEFGYTPQRDTNTTPLSDLVNQVKNALMTDGVTLTDTVSLPANKKNGQEFSLSIPNEFTVKQVLLTLPNSEEMDYTSSFHQNQKVTLASNAEGQFTAKIKVSLKDKDTKIDVFQPITWNWKMDQKDVTDVDVPEQPAPTEPAPSEPITDPEGDGETGGAESANVSGTEEQITTVERNESQATVQEVEIINNHITHKVMSSLIDGSTSILTNAASDTVGSYQKLLMLYDIYFGLAMDQFNSPDLANQMLQTNLADLSSRDSLYYLFNKQDIVEILANYVAEQTTEEIRQQTEDVKKEIEEYILLVNQADQNSVKMAELIKKATEQAESLNTNLSETLKDLGEWRESSLQLQDEQSTILVNGDEEHSAVLSLDNEFKSLLAVSQSLAEQSRSNLGSAEHVYQTFDAIENQANQIQASGTNLVQQADNLSNDLTNKLVEDQTFAENFAGVLANSRIGERPNENLLSFLSNPVETKNAGVITKGDTFTPYFVVLICFMVALFTAYVISNYEKKRLQNDAFEGDRTLVGNNTPVTIITASIGVLEGLVIGFLSAYLLKMNEGDFLPWIGMITLIMFTMLLVASYLLRQLKMFGMFILLVIMSMYLFLTEALGIHFDKSSSAAKLISYSPLQYIEKLLMKFGSGTVDNMLILSSLVAIAVISIIGHLTVFERIGKSGEVHHEGISESN